MPKDFQIEAKFTAAKVTLPLVHGRFELKWYNFAGFIGIKK